MEVFFLLITKLAILLAERNLKITKVSKDTGISRTTLTYLANNYTQGIQFDTLNKLCIYLKVKPQDFFDFIPIDIDLKISNFSYEQFDLQISLFERNKKFSFNLYGFYTKDKDSLSIDLSWDDVISSEDKEYVSSIFKNIPVSFMSQLESKLSDDFFSHLTEEENQNLEVFTLNWPNEFH